LSPGAGRRRAQTTSRWRCLSRRRRPSRFSRSTPQRSCSLPSPPPSSGSPARPPPPALHDASCVPCFASPGATRFERTLWVQARPGPRRLHGRAQPRLSFLHRRRGQAIPLRVQGTDAEEATMRRVAAARAQSGLQAGCRSSPQQRAGRSRPRPACRLTRGAVHFSRLCCTTRAMASCASTTTFGLAPRTACLGAHERCSWIVRSRLPPTT
jgi:hypothetical protein